MAHAELSGSLDFMADGVFAVDPRAQGFGLAEYGFLDGHANKFFLLAGEDALYISPWSVPQELLDYYDRIGIGAPQAHNIFQLPSEVDNGPWHERVDQVPGLRDALSRKRGALVVPFMATPSVKRLSEDHGLEMLADPVVVDRLADKELFLGELASLGSDIELVVGYNPVPDHEAFPAEDRAGIVQAYLRLSANGTKPVVLVKPKSASALGVFPLQAERGLAGLSAILDEKFEPGDRILVEEHVVHNHAPSMQGARAAQGDYNHLYLGRQFVVQDGQTVQYEANEIPFGPDTGAAAETLDVLTAISRAVGQKLVAPNAVAGIAGQDALIQLDEDGRLKNVKLTEMNLHLPGSSAVYAALIKVFPDGFDGIAHNRRINFTGGPAEFFRQFADLLVTGKNSYGIFPLNMSYSDRVDIIIFARDAEHLATLKGRLGYA